MAHQIILSPTAHDDEYDACKWYEKQLKGLGEEFLQELEIAYRKISLHPTYNGYIDGKKILRDYTLPRFPFSIIYRIVDETVQVITVHHFKKHPSKMYGRNK